ncbi:MAG TPA: META domain-containing protein [Gemmatimonadaceae bacterium]|jgi:heat shock protein HslJ
MIRHGKRILIIASVGVIACSSHSPSGQSARRSLRGVRWELVDVAGRPVVGSTGCNRLTGPFTFTGTTIHFGAAATTRMACLEAANNEQEQAVLAALSETDSYQIVKDTLNLARGTATLARFVAAAPR